MRITLFFVVSFLFVSLLTTAHAQAQRDVVNYIALLDKGNATQVRQAMPQLMTQFQNSPELTYLQARLEPDGIAAVKLYRGILENFPKCDYADDALLHVYQYDYMSGLYQSANQDLQRLKTEYPGSTALASVNEIVVPKEQPSMALAGSPATSAPPASIKQLQHAAPSVSSHKAPFALQVGAFSTTENAEKLKRRFEQLGYPVEISNKVMERKTLYVVWVGAFNTADQAKAEINKIRSREKVTPMVIER